MKRELKIIILRKKILNTIWGGLPRDKELLLNSYTLQIGWNDLGELPKEIGNLTNLIEIRAWCSHLKKLPKEIGNLKNLKELSLSENDLTQIPKEIGNLKNLKVLNLSNNPLQELPKEIGCLEDLLVLELTENDITELPLEIGRLQNLIELRLEDNKNLNTLPKELARLQNLGKIILYNNGINFQLPDEIWSLANQGYIHLEGDQYTNLLNLPNDSKINTIKVNNIVSQKSPREIFEKYSKLPIYGGWGYTRKDAVIINNNDPLVNVAVPFNSIDIEYAFARKRSELELTIMRDKNDRFTGLGFETISQVLIHTFNGNKYNKLILKVTALSEENFTNLDNEWKENLGNCNFDKEKFLNRKEKLKVHIQREFWFEISSFYGKNFTILNESD